MKLGFIGVGKIASAVINGLCTSNIENTIINLSPRSKKNSDLLASRFANVERLESNQLVLDQSDIIFISVLASDAEEILSNLKFKESHTVISFIPTIRLSELIKVVTPATIISRAIPIPTVAYHNCPIPIYNSESAVTEILSYLGKPLLVEDEDQLHTLWALTGFIAPFYTILKELSDWTTSKGVSPTIANRYLADLFYSLLSSNLKADKIDFTELVHIAKTPNGMNERAENEIKARGVTEAYKITADILLKRFARN